MGIFAGNSIYNDGGAGGGGGDLGSYVDVSSDFVVNTSVVTVDKLEAVYNEKLKILFLNVRAQFVTVIPVVSSNRDLILTLPPGLEFTEIFQFNGTPFDSIGDISSGSVFRILNTESGNAYNTGTRPMLTDKIWFGARTGSESAIGKFEVSAVLHVEKT